MFFPLLIYMELLELVVTTIAKRTFSAMLTATQIDGLSLFSCKRNWRKFSSFMATITKWLILT
jgi:hypothetical protein